MIIEKLDCTLVEVVDGDTVKVRFGSLPENAKDRGIDEGKVESLRIMNIDTEESRNSGTKPVTQFGRETSKWAKETFFSGITELRAEFVLDAAEDAFPRGNYNRLLVYLHAKKGNQWINYNLRLIEEGWSPYFEKYGHSRLYRFEMERAELLAKHTGEGLWGSCRSRGDERYVDLKQWWRLRAGQIEGYRRLLLAGHDILNSRRHYPQIKARIDNGFETTVFEEVRDPKRLSNGGLSFSLGSRIKPFYAYFPPKHANLGQFIAQEFAGKYGANYLYFRGEITSYNQNPQIVITDLSQVSLAPFQDSEDGHVG